MCYGYRVGEVPLPKLPAWSNKAKYYIRNFEAKNRPPVKVSLGLHAPYTLPHADPACSLTTIAGVRKRMASEPPKTNPAVMERFKAHVKKFVHEHFQPLDFGSDVSVETWLAATPYPEWRKKELRETYLKMDGWDDRWAMLKCFMKDESYPEYKYPRGIYSRTDEYKILMGPIFALISKQLFAKEQTIKTVPIGDRPREIQRRLEFEGSRIFETDYTSFEASFVAEIQNACEVQLYEYMVSEISEGPIFMENYRRGVLRPKQRAVFKDFEVYLEPKRMSGEMNTSLGNTFSNWVVMDFLCHENGAEYKMVVEGDDGLTTIVGPPPTTEQFAELGFIVKMTEHDTLSEASFCGLLFDPEELENITNPMEVIADFGWTRQRYWNASSTLMLSLMKAKALSLLYQYPGCPILSVFADHLLKQMVHVEAKFEYVDQYTEQLRHEVIQNIEKIERHPIGFGTRRLMEKKFGILMEDQVRAEQEIKNIRLEGILQLTSLDKYVPQQWREYYEQYHQYVVQDEHVNHPPDVWSSPTRREIFAEMGFGNLRKRNEARKCFCGV